MKVANHILELSGNTPKVRLRRIVPESGADILAKLEFFNPSASVKDRIALYMIEEAEKRGELKPGYRIVEASTGNTGIAFSLAAAIKGYPITIVMPDRMSEERKMVMTAYGAELVFTPGTEVNVDRAMVKAKEILTSDDRTWMPGQFENIDNVKAHQLTTGPEVVEQAGRGLRAFVAGVGSGGTLMGTARHLKEEGIEARIVAVEPEGCSAILHDQKGDHRIEGIGDGFIPKVMDIELISSVEIVSDEEAIAMARRMAMEEGILCGISSGANLIAALRVAEEMGPGDKVVTMVPDTGMRYFSTDLFKMA